MIALLQVHNWPWRACVLQAIAFFAMCMRNLAKSIMFLLMVVCSLGASYAGAIVLG